MKKILIIQLVLCFTLSCEKNVTTNNSLSHLKSRLTHVLETGVNTDQYYSPHSKLNHYDWWGSTFILAIKNCQDSYLKADGNDTHLLFYLNSGLPSDLSQESLHGIDLERIEFVFDEVLKLFVDREINEAIFLSFGMEKIIGESKGLQEKERELLLKLTSIIRHTTFYFSIVDQLDSKSEFSKCWRKKLQETQDSGFFTRLICVYSWPVCFGALALDCLIE